MLARLVSIMPVRANHHVHPACEAAILWNFHGTQAEAMLSGMFSFDLRASHFLMRKEHEA
jgi:hypothetical protein